MTGNTLVNMTKTSKAAIWQQNTTSAQIERQRRLSNYLDWSSCQPDGYEPQLPSSVPSKRAGSTTHLVSLEPESKRPSIVGFPDFCPIGLV